MWIETSRFGRVDVGTEQIWTFAQGLVGFPELKRMVLVDDRVDPRFSWLQSVDVATRAFCIVDPLLFGVAHPQPGDEPLRHSCSVRPGDVNVRLVVNCCGPRGGERTLTVNVQGPILLDTVRRLGQQRVLSEKRWSARVALPMGPIYSGSVQGSRCA